MWRPLLCVVLFIVAASHVLQAQSQTEPPRISPLFNYLTSNSYLHRSTVFRDMQSNIQQEMGKVQPGLRVDYFFDQMSAIHRALGQRLWAEYNGTDSIHIYLIDNTREDSNRTVLKSLRVAGSNISLDSLYNYVTAEWKKSLQKELTKVLASIKNEATARALKEQLQQLLFHVGVTDNLVEDNRDNGSVTPADSIVNLCFQAAVSLFERELKNRIDTSMWLNSINGSIAKYSLPLLNEFFNNVHSTIAKVLDKAEHILTTGVQEVSRWLISGNAGIAVTRGAGDFSSGVHLSYNFCQFFQMGAYVNSNFTADSSQPGRWLVGFQGRILIDKTQLDVLASALIGNHAHFKDWAVSEWGVALQNSSIISSVGFAIFTRDALNSGPFSSNTVSWAVLYKPLPPHAPTFLLGCITDPYYQSPFFKIIYPITAQQ